MGAEQFLTSAEGSSAKQAFNEIVAQAQYDHGHSGYTGTIAEKDSFIEIPLPPGKSALDYAQELLNNNDERIDDKWGPAGCIKDKDHYVFFGWASS